MTLDSADDALRAELLVVLARASIAVPTERLPAIIVEFGRLKQQIAQVIAADRSYQAGRPD